MTDEHQGAKEHREEVTESRHAYTVRMGGQVDGENTRSPVGYQAYDQAFEPNLWVRMENAGGRPVEDAWLIANGKDWCTVRSIVSGVVRPEMTDGEKALALWTFQRGHRFHASPYDRDNGNVVRMLNVYGYGLCGDDSYCLADLWREAGLRVRAGKPLGHSTTEVWYDGTWHLLDGDEHVICLMRDNRTIAGEEEIVADHDLMKRTHVYGVLRKDDRETDEFSASLFPHEGERPEEKGTYPAHRMGVSLRPGEALEWRWDGRGRFHGRQNPGAWRDAWCRVCNGRLVYAPALGDGRWRFGASETENVTGEGALALAGDGAGWATVGMTSPYAIVGGRVRARFRRRTLRDRCAIRFSADGEAWTEMWTAGPAGSVPAEVSLDGCFPSDGPARYGCLLRFEFAGGEGDRPLEDFEIELDVQMAPLSLPGLRLGENEMVYEDEGGQNRRVLLTHAWREREDLLPPGAPEGATFPEDGAEVEGTRFTFEWAPARDAAHGIADYHFRLSRDPEMRYALSPNFEKLISRTAQTGSTRYEIPYTGLLNPDETYFWQVRARNGAGVWGPWSPVRSFTPRAPGVPVNVRLEPDATTRRARLLWEDPKEGRRPVDYRVYGSDERGFSVSDAPYPVLVEKGRKERFPANFAASVRGRTLEVAGPDVKMENANRAFYRVVAVDEWGNRSGPSEAAAMPTPWILSPPPLEGRARERYVYPARATASIGDLRTVKIDGNPYNPAFRDGDELTWRLIEGPGWLRVDETGTVSGVPPARGRWKVRLRVESSRGGRDEQGWEVGVV